MEWQASYAAGALLTPARLLVPAIQGAMSDVGLEPPIYEDAEGRDTVVGAVSEAFGISCEAAGIRLRAHRLVRPASDRAHGDLDFTGS